MRRVDNFWLAMGLVVLAMVPLSVVLTLILRQLGVYGNTSVAIIGLAVGGLSAPLLFWLWGVPRLR